MILDSSKDSAKIGTIHENLAINQFLKINVLYLNVCQHGPIDIIVLHPDGQIELLDVKKRSVRKKEIIYLYIDLNRFAKNLM